MDTLLLVLPAMAGLVAPSGSTRSGCAAARRPASRSPPTWPNCWSGAGVPFREAHEVVGHLVVWCQVHDVDLAEVSDEDLATDLART